MYWQSCRSFCPDYLQPCSVAIGVVYFCTCCVLCIVVCCLVYIVVVLCVLLSSYVYLLYCVGIAFFTLDAGLLARS